MEVDSRERDRQRFRHANELPLNSQTTFTDIPAMEADLGLAPTTPSISGMRASLLANLLKAYLSGYEAIHFSRDRSHYSAIRNRYTLPFCTYRSVLQAATDLERAGLVHEVRSRPGTSGSSRSRLRLASAPCWLNAPWAVLTHSIAEYVRLKDEDKNLIDYDDTASTRAIRNDIAEQNAFLSGFRVEAPLAEAGAVNGLLPADEDGFRKVVHETYYRVFNEDWRNGGRWYGPWWQNVSKSIRAQIHINGQNCHEEDFRSFHPQLICAAAGIDLPFDDPDFDFYAYAATPSLIRGHLKLAANILFNAESRTSAQRAIRDKLGSADGIDRAADLPRVLIQRLEAAYPQLAPFWGTGVARRLQNVDGEMCRRIQRRLRRASIPNLSVHDSFIVPATASGTLRQIMDDELDRARHTLQKQGPKSLF